MTLFTTILNLLKKNPTTDGSDTFNIQTMLNDNWDKIDAAMALKTGNADVRVATTANITLSGTQTIDGVAVVAGDRVLVKNQTTGSQNGIYVVAAGAWARAVDADSSAKIAMGISVYVEEGSACGKTEWRMSNIGAVTLGTTALTFQQMSGTGSATDAVVGSRTITDTTVPTGDSGSLTSLFSWIGYMIKAITGKSSWRTAPAKTLEDLNTHIGSGGTSHAAVTTSVAGFMSAADKTKLDGIATGANNYVHPTGDGNQHVPASGTTNDKKVLKAGTTAGSAAWGSVDFVELTGTAGAATDAVIGNRTIDDTIAASVGADTPTRLWSKLANMIKAITGKSAWYTAPARTLEDLNTHIEAGGTVHAAATTASAGFMSATDKLTSDNRNGYGTTAGTGTAYTVTTSPASSALVDGLCVAVKIHLQNTGAATLNVNGLGAVSIKKANGNDVAAGNLKTNSIYTLRYNGTNFILQGEGGEYGTAVAADVLIGKTVGTESGIVNGTMPNRSGDTIALSSTVGGTTLKLLASSGYRDGVDDYVTITDPDFITANIKTGVNIFGLLGSLQPQLFASGDTTAYSVYYSASYGYYYYYIDITGLSFQPKFIHCWSTSGYSHFGLYNPSAPSIGKLFVCAPSGQIDLNMLGAEGSAFAVSANGFRLAFKQYNSSSGLNTGNIHWEAFG